MEVYNEVKNEASNAYLYNAIAGTAKHEHDEPDYNMQISWPIDEENNADRDNLIDIEVFKPINKNTTKRLRM